MTSLKTSSPSCHYISTTFFISCHPFYTMPPIPSRPIEFDHPHGGRKVKSCVLENDPPPRFDNLFSITAAVTAVTTCATLFHCSDLRLFLLLLLLLLLAVKPPWKTRWWLRQLFPIAANRLSCSWRPSSLSSAQGCTGQERWYCRSRQGGTSLGCRFERGLSAAAAGSSIARTNHAAGFLSNGGDSAATGNLNGTEGIRIGVRTSCISSGKNRNIIGQTEQGKEKRQFFTDNFFLNQKQYGLDKNSMESLYTLNRTAGWQWTNGTIKVERLQTVERFSMTSPVLRGGLLIDIGMSCTANSTRLRLCLARLLRRGFCCMTIDRQHLSQNSVMRSALKDRIKRGVSTKTTPTGDRAR